MSRPDGAVDADGPMIAGVALGEHGALASIFGWHASPMFGLASLLCGPEQAQEIVRDVLVDLWQHPERFDGRRGSLRSFLLAGTHRRAVDFLRSETTSRAGELKEALRGAGPADVDDDDMSHIAGDDPVTFVVRLPDHERRLIELAYFNGRTYREVAALVGEPEATVTSLIRSGLTRLRANLAPN